MSSIVSLIVSLLSVAAVIFLFLLVVTQVMGRWFPGTIKTRAIIDDILVKDKGDKYETIKPRAAITYVTIPETDEPHDELKIDDKYLVRGMTIYFIDENGIDVGQNADEISVIVDGDEAFTFKYWAMARVNANGELVKWPPELTLQ